jgi:hypothetical protein
MNIVYTLILRMKGSIIQIFIKLDYVKILIIITLILAAPEDSSALSRMVSNRLQIIKTLQLGGLSLTIAPNSPKQLPSCVLCAYLIGKKELREGGHSIAEKLSSNTAIDKPHRPMRKRFNLNHSRVSEIQRQSRRHSLSSTDTKLSNNSASTLISINSDGSAENSLEMNKANIMEILEEMIHIKINSADHAIEKEDLDNLMFKLGLLEGEMLKLRSLALPAAQQLLKQQEEALGATKTLLKALEQAELENGPITELKCNSCEARLVDVVLLPCGHQLFCSQCAANLTRCSHPQCNKAVDEVSEIVFDLSSDLLSNFSLFSPGLSPAGSAHSLPQNRNTMENSTSNSHKANTD